MELPRKIVPGLILSMFKVGDKIVLLAFTKKYGIFSGEIIKIGEQNNIPLAKIKNFTHGHEGDGTFGNREDLWWVYPGQVILEEVYHSPLYKALHEN